jgi:hypothetical protein
MPNGPAPPVRHPVTFAVDGLLPGRGPITIGFGRRVLRRGAHGRRGAADGEQTAPRRLAADGRTIRLGWFRSIDPQLLDLTGDTTRGRLDLLVVPPDTTAAAARQAFAAASDRANRRTPAAVLATLHPAAAPVPAAQPAVDRLAVGQAAPAGAEQEAAWDAQTAVWDSEGGHPLS